MAKKPDSLSLAPGEKVLWNGNRSKRSFISSTGKGLKLLILLVFASVFIAGLMALGSPYSIGETCCLFSFLLLGGVVVLPFLFQQKYQYAITNKRVFSRVGIFTRKINEIPLGKVVNTTYQQGFIGRLLGFGDLQFNSAAGADQGVVFKGIKNVKGLDQRFKKIKSSVVDDGSRKMEQTVNIKADHYDSKPKKVRTVDEGKKKRALPKLKKKNEKEDDKPVLKKAKSKENSFSKDEEKSQEGREINFCKKCGYVVDEETVYCERCGYKIRDQPEQ